LTADQTAKAVSKPKTDKQAKVDKPKRSSQLGGPGNPVHDTVKTVQGVLKQFAPKPAPKPKSAPKAKHASGVDAGGAS
jgi:hypothetical protein